MKAADYLKSLPDKVERGSIEGMSSVFHFDLSGDGGGRLTVVVTDGEVSVKEGLVGEPKCTVGGSAEKFMKVVEGKSNPLVAIMSGQIRVTNQGELIKYAKAFGLIKG